MKTRTALFCIVVLVTTLLRPAVCTAQKQGGLSGALDGRDDPTKDRRATQPSDKSDPTETCPLPVVNAAPDPNRFDKRIAQLEGQTGQTASPVPSLDAARRRIEQLRRRTKQLQTNNDRRVTALAEALSDESTRLEDR